MLPEPDSSLDTELPDIPPSLLSPCNFLDWLLLLWWLFIQPERLRAYKRAYGAEALYPTGARLVSALAWLPMLIILLRASPGGWRFAPSLPMVISLTVIALLLWVMTGMARDHDPGCLAQAIPWIAGGMAALIGASLPLLGGMALIVIYLVISGVAKAITGNITQRISLGMTLGAVFVTLVVGGILLWVYLVESIRASIEESSRAEDLVMFAGLCIVPIALVIGLVLLVLLFLILPAASGLAVRLADLMARTLRPGEGVQPLERDTRRGLLVILVLSYGVLIGVCETGS